MSQEEGLSALSDDPAVKALLSELPCFGFDGGHDFPLQEQLLAIRGLSLAQASEFRDIVGDTVAQLQDCAKLLGKLQMQATRRSSSLLRAHSRFTITVRIEPRGREPMIDACVLPSPDPLFQICGRPASQTSTCCGRSICKEHGDLRHQMSLCMHCKTPICILCCGMPRLPLCQYCDSYQCLDCRSRALCCVWARH